MKLNIAALSLFFVSSVFASVVPVDSSNFISSKVQKVCRKIQRSTTHCTDIVNFEPALLLTINVSDDSNATLEYQFVASGNHEHNSCYNGRETCQQAIELLNDEASDALKRAWTIMDNAANFSSIQLNELSYEVLPEVYKVACYRPIAKLHLEANSPNQVRRVEHGSSWQPCPKEWLGNL